MSFTECHRCVLFVVSVCGLCASTIEFGFATTKPLGEDELGQIIELLEPYSFRDRVKSIYDQRSYADGCEDAFDGAHGNCLMLRGLQHIEAGDIESGVRVLKEAARIGSSFAEAKLGEVSLLLNTQAGLDDAIYWYKRAAKSGNPIAQYMLVRLGLLFPKRVCEGSHYLMTLAVSSAEQGIVPALKLLGDVARDGLLGMSPDPDQAFAYFLSAAHKGFAPAQYEVGMHYIESGLIGDAISWLEKAALSGLPEAHYRLGLYYWSESDTTSQLADKAVHHLQIALDDGIAESSLALGTAYLTGRGVTQDYDRARSLLSAAVGSSDGFAESLLGQIYARGLGVDKDLNKGCYYFELSAHADNSHGQYGHGICLHAQDNPEEGLMWIRKAADQGLARAIIYLEQGK